MANPSTHERHRLPARAGVGLKPEHYHVILDERPVLGFFEVHAENYMGAGGPPHRYLSAIRDHYPLSLHGVGLSIGGDRPLDLAHLTRLKKLDERYAPGLFSEHLAWSSDETGFLNDLLPVSYTAETLRRVVDHVDQVQQVLKRQMLLENPSTYLAYAYSTYSETEFIAEVAKRSGCGLLLDINNVYVASVNQEWEPYSYLDAFPLSAVQEIHLAGHTRDWDEAGRPLLIDTHDRPVDHIVWDLFTEAVCRCGPVPTLIEWDANVPDWPILKAQADRAESVLRAASLASRTGRRQSPARPQSDAND